MAEIEFGTFEAPEKVNPYAGVIEKLAKANDENAAITLTIDVNDSKREQLKIQKAANAIGKTARLRHTDTSGVTAGDVDEDGNPTETGDVKLTFTLTEKHKARRSKSAE